jgi:hypothetical protein
LCNNMHVYYQECCELHPWKYSFSFQIRCRHNDNNQREMMKCTEWWYWKRSSLQDQQSNPSELGTRLKRAPQILSRPLLCGSM